MAIAHTIIAGEVAGRLSRGHDIIGGQRVFRVRQGDVDNLGPRIFHHRNARLPQRLDLIRHAIHAVFARDADLFATDVTRQCRLKIRHGQVGTGGIQRVMPRHAAQHNRRIAHAFGHRASLIQG